MNVLQRWLPAHEIAATEWIFYDGHCGLCHGAVTFVLARDHRAVPFHFAPLESDAVARLIDAPQRATLPDSIVVRTGDGRVLTRSAAVLHIGRRLGGLWGALAAAAGLVPAPLRDFCYRVVARIRHRLFAPPDDVCPMMPAHLRSRFET